MAAQQINSAVLIKQLDRRRFRGEREFSLLRFKIDGKNALISRQGNVHTDRGFLQNGSEPIDVQLHEEEIGALISHGRQRLFRRAGRYGQFAEARRRNRDARSERQLHGDSRHGAEKRAVPDFQPVDQSEDFTRFQIEIHV